MRRLTILLILVAFVAVPTAALAQEEPYSSSTTSVAPCEPSIAVTGSGFTLTFNATCVTVTCDWTFGDGATGEGNPVTRTYAAEGDYIVTATCGPDELTRTVTVTEDLAYTGFGLLPFGLAIGALVLLGGAALFASRRARASR